MSKLDELIKEYCPDGVEYKSLGELGKFYGGLTGKSKDDFTDGNAVFISYKNVYANPSLDIHPADRVKITEGENQRTLEYGDIIFTGSSETPDECGFSSVVAEHPTEPLYLNSFCFFYRLFDIDVLNPDFAKHLFRSDNLRYQIGKTASGVTRFNVSKDKMAKVSIPVPPLPVQEEIVRILDTFTELTAELQAELQARKKQYEYYRVELIESVKDCPKYRIPEIAETYIGLVTTMTKHYVSDGVPLIHNSDIKENRFEFKNITYLDYDFAEKNSNRKHHKGDVITVHTGDVGTSAIINDDLDGSLGFATIVSRIKEEKMVIPEWLCHCLNSKMCKDQIQSLIKGDRNNLNLKDFDRLVIPVPTIIEQERIITILDSFNSIINSISSGLPAEIEARQKQYEYYRDKLLTFKPLT